MPFESFDNLRNPAVIIALGGWADAASAGVDLIEHLIDCYPSTEMAPINDEKYFDYQQYRPILHHESDGTWVEWPSITLQVLSHPERDLLVVVGPEPQLLWRSFAKELLRRIRECNPRMVVTLGAMLADSPHTQPLPVGIYSNDALLLENVPGISRLDYSGPSSVLGVLGVMLDGTEVTAAQVWVSVPHYAADPPNPKAQLSLLGAVEEILGMSLERADLEEDSAEWTEAVNELVADNPGLAEYVGELEIACEEEEKTDASGEEIAAEIEKYLRGMI